MKNTLLMTGMIGTAFLCFCFAALAAASHRLEMASGDAAREVTIRLNAVSPVVTALQFDVEYDAAVCDLRVSTARSAELAGKTIQTASPAPNRLRVLVFGFNQTVISNGPVATIRAISRPGKPAPRSLHLQISGVAASDSAGKPVVMDGPDAPAEISASPQVDR
jgi:hypothetical protein